MLLAVMGKKWVFKHQLWFQMKQIGVILTHSKLWVALARHSFEWVKFNFDNVELQGLGRISIYLNWPIYYKAYPYKTMYR